MTKQKNEREDRFKWTSADQIVRHPRAKVTIEERDGKWVTLAEDGSVMWTYDTEEAARAAVGEQ